METIAQFLKNSQTFYLATDDNGQPRVRPFGAVCVFNGRLYFCFNNKKAVFAQIKANPKIEISATAASGDKWLRLSAEAVVHESPEARRFMLDALPALQGMYSADDGLFEVFYLQNAVGVIQSFGGEAETHTF